MSKFWEMLSSQHQEWLKTLQPDQAIMRIRKNYSDTDGVPASKNTLREIESLNDTLLDIGSINEIGAGDGRTARAIKTLYPKIKYHIIDIEPALTIAKRELADTDVYFVSAESGILPKADLTLAISVLSELDDAEIRRYIELANSGIYCYIKDWWQWEDNRHRPINMLSYRIPEHWQNIFLRDYELFPGFFEGLWKT